MSQAHSLSASIFRRGGQKKELFSGGANNQEGEEGNDDEGVLVTVQELHAIVATPKSGSVMHACTRRVCLTPFTQERLFGGDMAACDSSSRAGQGQEGYRASQRFHLEETALSAYRGGCVSRLLVQCS